MQLVINAEKEKYENFVRLHTLETKMELKEFFKKNSPHAFQAVVARILEVKRKGYQKFDEKMLNKLAKEYIESVATQGMACCELTCNNIALNQLAANIISIYGVVSPRTMLKFQNQVKITTGLDIKTPDWVKEAGKKEFETSAGIAPGKVKEDAGSKKLEYVKGYEMKEKKDETDTELPASGVSVAAILIVIGIVALVGRGLWKGMRRH
ncbi:MAG: hypothetical protein QMC83_05105 [Thermodesulfovibrionales bacterium]|nr:hypothetical protein [Thermodesulfovibrionales bacterium]